MARKYLPRRPSRAFRSRPTHSAPELEREDEASCPATGFSATLAELNSGAACAGGKGIIDPVLSAGKKSGYVFAYATVQGGDNLNDTYTTTAVPATIGTTGQRGFYSDQTGVIRYTLTGAAPTNASNSL